MFCLRKTPAKVAFLIKLDNVFCKKHDKKAKKD